jgi:hypothetical protein
MERKIPKPKTERVGKGRRVVKPIVLMPHEGIDSGEDFERWIVQTAIHFTMAHRVKPGQNNQVQFKTLREAIAAKLAYDAKPALERNSRMGLVYAVNAAGRRAMIAPHQFDEMLKVRGEVK